MKKLYSIVLMAAALLIGTNVKAVDVATFEALQTAITDAPAATLTAITLTADISATAQININGGKNVEINLNNHEINSNSRIVVDNGQLTLKGNGTLTSSTIPIDMRGSYADVANYSVVTVENGVNVVSTCAWGICLFQNSQTDENKKPSHGYGLVLNFDGHMQATAASEATAIWVLGNIQQKTVNIPQVHIGPHAVVVAADNGVGLYGGGYAIYDIQGQISGGAGIYAKAGVYNISGDAVITATSPTYTAPTANGNGFSGGMGCGIVSDSKNGYAGGMEIIITGNATVQSETTGGYSLLETKTDATQTKTESLVIESGTFNGNISTTAELQEEVKVNGTITGGTFDTDITGYLNNVTGVITPVTDENGNTTYVINEKPTADPWKTTIVGASATDYVRMNNAGTVTLSEDAQAKYLVMQGNDKIVIPSGKKMTVEEIVMGEDAVIEVAAGGKLIVTGAQGIVSNHASNLVLHTSETEQAIFLLNPAVTSNKHPKATVEFITKSFMKAEVNVFQRFGIPTHTALESMECSDPSIRTRVWEYSAATDSWQEFGDLGSFDIHQLNVPFAGYNMISYRETPGLVYTMKGALVGNDDASLDANMHWTTFANSFSADIDVAQFVASINGTVDPTVYMYKVTNALTQEYTWEPVNATILGDFHDESLSKIAPMRAFILNNKGTSAQLNAVNYASMVWAPATSVPNPAPRRAVASNNTAKLSVRIANEQGAWDKLYLLENDDFSAEYESGRDAEKYMNEDINVYAQAEEKQAILATNDLSDTYVGFSTVKGGKFTISFANVAGREFVLVDHETGARVAMVEGNTYEFTAAANSANDYRFEIVGAAKLPTAIENTEAVKSAKGVYTITGQYVGEMNVWNTLPAGIYVVNGEKRVK